MNEDICLWPDGDWCYRKDLWERTWKSDDYEIIKFETPEWHAFDKR